MTEPATLTPALTHDLPLKRDRGGALSFGVVAAIFGGLLAVGLTLAVVIHRSYVGFERVAAFHIPPDTSFVLRWDVEKVALFEPTRHFLLPLFDLPRAGAAVRTPAPSAGTPAPVAGTSTGTPRRDRFATESGSMIARDLREVVALFGPGEQDFALVFAGSFPKGDLVAAVGRVFAAEGWAWRPLDGDRLVSPGGAALGRSEDGAIVLASSVERLDAALVRHAPLPEVPRIGAAALRLRPSASGLPAGTADFLGELGPVAALDGTAHWANPMPVELTLRYSGSPPADAKERIRRVLGRLLGNDLPRIEHDLAPVRIEPAGAQALTVTLLFDDVLLQRVAKRAAESVEQAVGRAAGAEIEP